MNPILLVAINARYTHPNLGLRCLLANLGDLRPRAILNEFTLSDTPDEMARRILDRSPALVAIGVYIWNRRKVEELVDRLREARPELPVILGGPEISYDTESPLARKANCVVCHEADRAFATTCTAILAGQSVPPVIMPDLPDPAAIALPYGEYTEDDLANRILYVETSRGCLYGCEYCVSAIAPGVRYFDTDRLFAAFHRLLDRGATRFKFVDRTFNLNPEHAGKVLDFFLERWRSGMCLHLEMTPTRLPDNLRSLLLRFPPGGLHIEVGIQTFNPAVSRRVGRPLDIATAENTLRFLVQEVKATVHADLIAGLPGESTDSFESGFDRLAALQPAEIQVGILKRLHGTRIDRHAAEWRMEFRTESPYDILGTSGMDAVYLDGVRRFASHWERIVNRGLLPHALSLISSGEPSIYHAFDACSRYVAEHMGLHSLNLVRLTEVLFEFLTRERGLPESEVRNVLRSDFSDQGRRRSLPHFLDTI